MATEADLIQKFKDLNIPVGTDFEELIHEAFVGANLVDKVDNHDSRIATLENDLSATKGSVQAKVTDNKDGTEQLNGIQVQPYNKLSDTVGGRNMATNLGDVLVTPVDDLGWSGTVIGKVTPEFFKLTNQGTTQPITISFEINTPDDPTKTNIFDRIEINGYSFGYDNVIGNDYFSVFGFKWFEIGNNVWKGTYSLQFDKGSDVVNSDRPNINIVQAGKNTTPHNFTVLGNSLCLYWGTQAIDWTPAPEDKADDSKVVHKTGDEEISGSKTFDTAPIDKTTGNPYITKSDVTTAVSAATANMAEDSKVAHLAGINNFTGSIQHNGNSVGAHIQASNNDEDSAINDSTNGNSDDIYYWFED